MLKFIPIKDKLLLADSLIYEVVKSKDCSVNNAIAERIVVNIIKSSGNKVTSFMVAD
jgi:hypothetical protein